MNIKKIFSLISFMACVAILSACFNNNSSKKNGDFSKIFKEVEKIEVAVSLEETDLGTNITNIYFAADDLVRYDSGFDKGIVYNMRTKEEIIAGDSKTYNVQIENKGKDLIVVDREINGMLKRAFFNKKGEMYLNFDEKNYNVTYVAYKDNIFSIDGDVYKGSNKIIHGGGGSSNQLSIFDEIIYQRASYSDRSKVFYDLNGNITSAIELTNNQAFYFINGSTALIATTYEMPFDSKDYTFSDSYSKYKLSYEKLDLKTGKKQSVKFNYVIQSLSPAKSVYEESELTESARNYGRVLAYSIDSDKLISNEITTIFVDKEMKIKELFYNINEIYYINKNYSLVKSSATQVYSLLFENNKVVGKYGNCIYYKDAQIFSSDKIYFNKEGKEIFSANDFKRLNYLYNGYFYAEQETALWLYNCGFINQSGEYNMILKNVSSPADTVNIYNKYLYIYHDITSSFTMPEIRNIQGEKLTDYNQFNENILTYYFEPKQSAKNSIYLAMNRSGRTIIFEFKSK